MNDVNCFINTIRVKLNMTKNKLGDLNNIPIKN